MKKLFNLALFGAIALTGAVGFSSCSSSNDEVINNPDYNPEQNSVKTQFTISFPKNVASTRQSATTVQNAQTIASFRGMDNIVLLPFAATGAVNTDPITSTSSKLGDKISLTTILLPSVATVNNEIPASTTSVNALVNASNSVLYNDVTIPVGTGSFLFYGKAKDSGTENFVNGALTMTEGQPQAITFDPVQIYPSTTTASTVGAALANYLSSIAAAADATDANITWAGCSDATTNSSKSWYNASLGDLYTKFIGMKAGSSRTVQAAVQDLYSTIKNNTDAVSIAIKTAIEANTYVSNTTSGVLTFTAAIGNSEATYFPRDVNLPDGAALLSFDATTKTFTQTIDGNGNTGTITAKYADYVYPASLYYYCNSGIKTSNSSQQSAYNGTDDWSTISGKYTAGTSVGTGTRSVAILDPIQYGVGRLDATVKLENATTLYDKNGDAYAVPASGFTVTGILIGGQKQVGYDFTPITTSADYTIFDNITKSQSGTTLTAKDNTGSAVNYTLALETAADQPVNVAVELLNNGDDFEGADGVVPAGCKFYLVAQLTPNASTQYNATTMNQVFRQDYKTIAAFTIKAGYPKTDTTYFPNGGNTVGLAKAYNTIPDLRTPQLELGLSVDMTWQSGLQFSVDL
jgi:hypothetical protein